MVNKKVFTITSILSILAIVIGFLLGGGYYLLKKRTTKRKTIFW